MKKTEEADVYQDFAHPNDIYKKMIEEIQDYAIILLDKNGFIQSWNKGAEKIKLYKEEEIIGKHFSIFYMPEDISSHLPEKLMKTAAEMGRAVQEGWRKRKVGSRFWANVTITALHDDQNNVIGYCKVTRDLTDKKEADDRLRMSEERYHRMIAEVQDYAIILLSPEGIIENWNAGAENIKGYKASEIIGKSFEIFYTLGDRSDGLPGRLLNEAKRNGKAAHQGWRIRKDGTKFWGSITITALHSKNNAIIGFSKVTRDLTQQKIAEDKMIAYTSELEIQKSELEQFAYVASHDLQEPLRKIQTFSELIRDNIDDKDFVDRYFKKLDLSAIRMSDLIKSLLNYSHLTNPSEELAMTEVDLNDVIADTILDFELLISEKKSTIKIESLPTVKGNATQLGQVFSNIISNALKFSQANPVIKLSSKIVSRDQIAEAPKTLNNKTYHQVIIEDNGIGFEEEYSKLIFTLFQRLNGKQEYAGTGIGLALCKKIMDNHKGHITATSKFGEGSTFNVYFPIED
jgi:PAS domain S-box-containing protein